MPLCFPARGGQRGETRFSQAGGWAGCPSVFLLGVVRGGKLGFGIQGIETSFVDPSYVLFFIIHEVVHISHRILTVHVLLASLLLKLDFLPTRGLFNKMNFMFVV